MNVSPTNYNTAVRYKTNFGHGDSDRPCSYNDKQKALIATSSAIGVLAGLALLAKKDGYSLNPKRMFKNFKQSYLYKADYEDREIITMGAGSCLGGLAAGFVIDKNKENRKAKLRETLMQIANVAVPIIFVTKFAKGGKYLGQKFFEKNKFTETYRSKIPKAIAAMVGLFSGVWVSNIVANKINEKIFHQGKGRPVKLTDFSAHVDDMCMAASQIDNKNPIIKTISRCIPAVLTIPGIEVGKKEA